MDGQNLFSLILWQTQKSWWAQQEFLRSRQRQKSTPSPKCQLCRLNFNKNFIKNYCSHRPACKLLISTSSIPRQSTVIFGDMGFLSYSNSGEFPLKESPLNHQLTLLFKLSHISKSVQLRDMESRRQNSIGGSYLF